MEVAEDPPMAPLLRRLCAWSATMLPALAQGVTVPASLTGVEGGSGSSLPFGTNQPVRYQCVYDADELPWSGPRAIGVLSLRADNTDPGVTTFPAKGFVVLSLALSTTGVRAADASTGFAQNHGNDRTDVIGSLPLMLPFQPPQPGVRAATIDLVLPTPWIHGLTPVRNNQNPPPEGFAFELVIHSQPAGQYRIDNVGSCVSPTAAFGQVGPACALAPGMPLTVSTAPGASMQAGSPFTWTVANAPANAAVMLLLNITSQGVLFGQPSLAVPLPLFDPQNPSLPPPALAPFVPGLAWGAPDCWLNLVPAATMFAVASAAGTATFVTPVGGGRQLVGMSLHAQAAAQAQTVNPLLLITSAGWQATVCGPLGVARIYAAGSATALTGQRSLGQGAVIELR
jgi:hypothetical protein